MTAPRGVERTPAQLGIIRMGLLAGVLLLGAVIYFLHRQPGYVPERGMEPLRPFIPIFMLAAIGGIVALRFYLARITDPRRLGTFQIIGWSIAEAVALLGSVYYFNTDDPRFYIMGLFVMLASFIVLPLRR